MLVACEKPNNVDNGTEGTTPEPVVPENAISTLTEDVTVHFTADSSLCFADCFGDYYRTGLYMWQFYFMDFTTKEQLCIEVMVQPNGLEVPTGTFAATANISQSNGMLLGAIDEDGYKVYSWYIRLASDAYTDASAPIAEGSMTITANADGTYTATFDLRDDAGNSIKGDYLGMPIPEDFRQ